MRFRPAVAQVAVGVADCTPMPSSKRNLLFNEEFPELAAALAGQLRVERELGRGGMGVVYLARDERLDRFIALKVLPATHATDSTTVERFLREARTAARLAHPNVVPVYHAGEVGGTAYFTMGFVEGESLADRVRDRGPLRAVDAVPILRDVAWALAYAHARGVRCARPKCSGHCRSRVSIQMRR